MPNVTVTITLVEIATSWSEAVDSYQSEKARDIAMTLIPLLVEAKAIDRASAIPVERWAFWVHPLEGKQGVEREYILGE